MGEQVSIHRATYALYEGILDQGVTASYRKGDHVSFINFDWKGVRWEAYIYEYIYDEPQVYRLKVEFDIKYYKMDREKHTERIQALKSMKEEPSFVGLEFAFMPDEALDLMEWYAKVMFYSSEDVKTTGIPRLPHPIKMDYEPIVNELTISRGVLGLIPPGGNTMTDEAWKTVRKHQGI